VLIIRPGGIGDAVLLIPALRVLKERFPLAQIDVLAETRNAEIFTLCEAVTRIFLYHRVRDLARVLLQSYDLVIDTEQWHRLSAVVAFLTRAPVRAGFVTNERARLFSHCVPYDQCAYEVSSFLRLVESVTGEPIRMDQEVPFIVASPRRLDQNRSRPTVVLSPGASIPEKRWGDQRFAELAARLTSHGCAVAVVGGNAERKQARRVCFGGSPNVTDLTGRLSLREVAALLAGADVLVTPDSGLLHLASAVGTATVSLFGASNKEKWAPKGREHRILSAELPCSPCSAFGYTPRCPIDIECLRQISVEDVLTAILELLAQQQLRRPPGSRAESLSPAGPLATT
jgi:lipopolysaccharide heptosyltransferase II